MDAGITTLKEKPKEFGITKNPGRTKKSRNNQNNKE